MRTKIVIAAAALVIVVVAVFAVIEYQKQQKEKDRLARVAVLADNVRKAVNQNADVDGTQVQLELGRLEEVLRPTDTEACDMLVKARRAPLARAEVHRREAERLEAQVAAQRPQNEPPASFLERVWAVLRGQAGAAPVPPELLDMLRTAKEQRSRAEQESNAAKMIEDLINRICIARKVATER